MQNKPLVTVICISYNHEKYVVSALNSVINQTYENVELIITDDYSTDNSKKTIEKWLEKHENILFIPNTKNLGNTKTFNNAAKQAKGDYIIDLAADDILLTNCIETQIKTFKNSKYKNLGIVYANINLIDENDEFISTYYNDSNNPESGNVYKMVIGKTENICSTASIVKKEVFNAVGYYNETLAYEDLDLWVRASRVFNFEYIPMVLAHKRELPNSLGAHFFKKSNKKTKMLHQSTIIIFEKILQLNKTKDEYRIMLNRIWFEFITHLRTRDFGFLFKLFKITYKAFIKSL